MVEYRQIEGQPGYRFGSDGTVWTRLVRTYKAGRIGPLYVIGREWVCMNPATMDGYYVVRLAGCRRIRKLHALLLEAFVCRRPDGMVARHLDDVRTNNAITNLAWGTYGENSADALKNGGMKTGDRHSNSKITECDAEEVRVATKYRGYRKDLAEKFGISVSLVNQIRGGRARKGAQGD